MVRKFRPETLITHPVDAFTPVDLTFPRPERPLACLAGRDLDLVLRDDAGEEGGALDDGRLLADAGARADGEGEVGVARPLVVVRVDEASGPELSDVLAPVLGWEDKMSVSVSLGRKRG